MAALGAVVGVAGIAYTAYRYFAEQTSDRDEQRGEGDSGEQEDARRVGGLESWVWKRKLTRWSCEQIQTSSPKGKEPARKRHRGTLSICCSNEVRPLRPSHYSLVDTLLQLPPLNELETLCSQYTVHLILRTSAPSSPSDPDSDPYPRPPVPSELYGVKDLDVRRVLFYSRPQGRIHVVRALGCDVHVEIWQEAFEKSGPEESQGEGSWILPEEEVTPQRLVKDLKTFVGSLVFVGDGVANEDLEGAHNARSVKTFADAVRLLV